MFSVNKFITLIITCFGLLFFSSCSVSSRVALGGQGGRNSYNQALQMTTAEQMLLNLVRLRYCDSPYFLDVNTITTQFIYNTRINPLFLIPGFTNKNPFELGSEFQWQNQPTIQYTPLEGQQFAVQLLRPIDILTIQHLILSGWDVDRVLKLTIQSFDDIHNAPTASGPIQDTLPEYKMFYEMAKLMREFQLDGALHIGSNIINGDPNIDSEDYTTGQTDLKDVRHKFNSMRVVFPAKGEAAEKLSSILQGSRRKNGRYVLDIDLGFSKDAGLGLIPRSVLGCMYYLSLGVIVPKRDIELGAVPLIKKEDGSLFDWQEMLKGLMTIHHSYRKPENASICVKHRDYWYYIDNSDICSKRTFALLQLLYSLQSNESRQLPTLLSLPIGN